MDVLLSDDVRLPVDFARDREWCSGLPGDVIAPAGLGVRLVVGFVSKRLHEWCFDGRCFDRGVGGWNGHVVAGPRRAGGFA